MFSVTEYDDAMCFQLDKEGDRSDFKWGAAHTHPQDFSNLRFPKTSHVRYYYSDCYYPCRSHYANLPVIVCFFVIPQHPFFQIFHHDFFVFVIKKF